MRPSALRILWLSVILAFGLNVLMPMVAASQVAGSAAHLAGYEEAEFTALYGEQVVICTRNGFKLVSYADLQEHPDAPAGDYSCLLCFTATQQAKLHLAGAGVALLHPLPIPRPVALRLASTPLPAALVDDTAHPRAPPSLPIA